MNGYSKYSKIRQASLPISPRLTSNNSFQSQGIERINDSKYNTPTQDSLSEKRQEEEEEVGEIFGVILSRSCSVSSVSAHGEKGAHEKQNPATIERAVRRAFSMRRSASLADGYCRIHNQSDFIADEFGKATTFPSRKTKKKRGKILKACRLIFGF